MLVVANWKANLVDAKKWREEFAVHCSSFIDKAAIEVAAAAPFTSIVGLSSMNNEPSTINISLAAQDVSVEEPGAFTGEIPAELLKNTGVKYCLLGHSERRKFFGETTDLVEKKLDRCITAGVIPIVCAQTLDEIPKTVAQLLPEKFYIMYEPYTAISTGGNFHPESAPKILAVLQKWQEKLPAKTRFLYGGSINPENATNYYPLTTNNLLSGFVIGHASLDPKSFCEILTRLCSSPA